jgi:DNA (cytosine-5)-methyltransferase 1
MNTATTEYLNITPAARPLRVGSLCTGYGGLDLAVERVLGASMDWCAESDSHAGQVLAAHWPAVPNFGDLRNVDWLCAPPVDVVTAGFPCQPVSNAGRRKGTEDDRWLWPDMAEALRWIRPRYVVLENVAAIVNRGMDTVLGALAALGFDAVWGCYRASWAGAPHRRDRWFLYGWRQGLPGSAADAAGQRRRGPAVQTHAEPGSGTARPFPSSGNVLAEAPADAAGFRHGHTRAPARGGLPAVPVGGVAAVGGHVDWGEYGPGRRMGVCDRPGRANASC